MADTKPHAQHPSLQCLINNRPIAGRSLTTNDSEGSGGRDASSGRLGAPNIGGHAIMPISSSPITFDGDGYPTFDPWPNFTRPDREPIACTSQPVVDGNGWGHRVPSPCRSLAAEGDAAAGARGLQGGSTRQVEEPRRARGTAASV